MEELKLASQEAAGEVMTIQGELAKFKNYGVKYVEWLNRSGIKKDDSNHTIVKKFYEDHESIFPRLSKFGFQYI